jgi:glycosyltransferase involved in cell wall biosynthesis
MSNNFFSHLRYYFNFIVSRIKGRIVKLNRLKVVSFKPEGISKGNVLISYNLDPFLAKSTETVCNKHTQNWENVEMVKVFLELGYCVDVMTFFNDIFVPDKDYSIVIDTRHNLERLAPLLNRDCIRILYADTAHIIFHNAAECNRLYALQQRKGISLCNRRFELPNKGIEHADCAILLGNEFTINTFMYARKPIYRVPISTTQTHPFPEEKDFVACSKRFLWLGSDGLVHKGLDLVLEAFAQMPDYHLTVCGPVNREPDFEKAYFKELYHADNIYTHGWIDVSSPEFIKVANSCLGIIYPSCSEGGGGCVIVCMHAGLIPIVTYEASVDVKDDYGVVLKEASVQAIKQEIQKVSSLPPEELKAMARRSWEFVRTNHTRENYAREYRNVIREIIATFRKQTAVRTTDLQAGSEPLVESLCD